jgi:hypothetical protein
MERSDDGLAGRSYDTALDLVELLPNPEDQAQALIRRSELLATPRGTALMKKIAAQTTPGCKKLYDVLRTREAERESKKAALARRKARAKGQGIVFPSLFDVFGLALPFDDIDETHDRK